VARDRGVETAIPDERRIDGVAEVTFGSVLPPLLGRKQTRLAFQDEVNVFRRTLLYVGPPNSARWYDVAGPGENAGARAVLYLRRRDGVRTGAFRKHINELARTLAGTGVLRELRTQVFLPWNEKLWDTTPNVAHDKPCRPAVPRLPPSGLRGSGGAGGLLQGPRGREPVRHVGSVCLRHPPLRRNALTYLKDGKELPHYQR
jgi:hypothetical protein